LYNPPCFAAILQCFESIIATLETNAVHVLACATQGAGSDDEDRLRALVSAFDATFFDLERRDKRRGALRLLKLLRSREFDLLVLEGSGMAGCLPAIVARILWRIPYILSSGDAIAPYLSIRHPLGRPLFELFERTLYAWCAGFIGWTPYLAGRALTHGAPLATTIPGWAPYATDSAALREARAAIRRRFSIPDDALVFGIVGSLNWSQRFNYCYGAELVRAARLTKSHPYVLIVGSGSGLDLLRKLAEEVSGATVIFPGRVPRSEVPGYLAAIDVGSIPQSVNAVGSFRYTTKLAEYRAARLPFITNQIPMAFDLDDGAIFRLPGKSPWDPTFIHALANLMDQLALTGVARDFSSSDTCSMFDRDTQVCRATAFIREAASVARSRNSSSVTS
jgi:hypothetical protein